MGNVETVQRIYQAFGAGDVPAILELLADDVEWEQWDNNQAVASGVPWMTPRRGRTEAAKFFETAAQMEIVDLQIIDIMASEKQVAVEFVLEANLPAFGGGHYRDEEMHLWTFDDEGKVVRLRHYVDTAKHIAAFGGAT
jgi:uncharacterized protein